MRDFIGDNHAPRNPQTMILEIAVNSRCGCMTGNFGGVKSDSEEIGRQVICIDAACAIPACAQRLTLRREDSGLGFLLEEDETPG